MYRTPDCPNWRVGGIKSITGKGNDLSRKSSQSGTAGDVKIHRVVSGKDCLPSYHQQVKPWTYIPMQENILITIRQMAAPG